MIFYIAIQKNFTFIYIFNIYIVSFMTKLLHCNSIGILKKYLFYLQ